VQVQLEVNAIIEAFRRSESIRINSFLNYLRTNTRANYVVSALNTNLLNIISYGVFEPFYINPNQITQRVDGKKSVCGMDDPVIAATLGSLADETGSHNRRARLESEPNSTIVNGFLQDVLLLKVFCQVHLNVYMIVNVLSY
jgi:hypothetical protein